MVKKGRNEQQRIKTVGLGGWKANERLRLDRRRVHRKTAEIISHNKLADGWRRSWAKGTCGNGIGWSDSHQIRRRIDGGDGSGQKKTCKNGRVGLEGSKQNIACPQRCKQFCRFHAISLHSWHVARGHRLNCMPSAEQWSARRSTWYHAKVIGSSKVDQRWGMDWAGWWVGVR